jgi:hypothetical protein
VTDEELRDELQEQLAHEENARARVRIEWQLTAVSTRIIEAVIKERFKEQT